MDTDMGGRAKREKETYVLLCNTLKNKSMKIKNKKSPQKDRHENKLGNM